MSTARPTAWLVTGANRGLGFEFVLQLLKFPTNLVVAATRTPGKATRPEEDGEGDTDLQTILGDNGLDYLAARAEAFSLDAEILLNLFKTNVIGPALLSQIALPFLEQGSAKKILPVHISSTGGSIGSVDSLGSGINTPYAISKAALTMLAYKQKAARPDLSIVAVCPGWVKTDMGGFSAGVEPRESVAGILKVNTSATAADSGQFLRYNGEEIP